MAQSVIIKKEEKVKAVFEAMQNSRDFQEFKERFISMYPEDWERIQKRYLQHERRDTKGKGHPMPTPDRYLENMYNNHKFKSNQG